VKSDTAKVQIPSGTNPSLVTSVDAPKTPKPHADATPAPVKVKRK
jgi:hypothetical protein